MSMTALRALQRTGTRFAAAVIAVAAASAASATLTQPLARAATAVPALRPAPANAVSVVPGVKYWPSHFFIGRDYETAVFQTIDLTNPHITINAAVAHYHVNAPYQDVPTMAARTGAVAGINADFFQLGTYNGVTEGGIIRSGVIYKTPRAVQSGNFYIRASGTAGIGHVGFTGTITVGRTSHAVASVNNVQDAASEATITEITPAMAGTWLPRRCLLLTGVKASHTQSYRKPGTQQILHRTVVTFTVQAHAHTSYLQKLALHADALLGCGASGLWLSHHELRGTVMTLTERLSTGPLYSLASGGRLLVSKGTAYDDRHAHPVSGHNSETFACTDQSGTHVLWGVFDRDYWGRGGDGITNTELQGWMLHAGCYNGMVFDGGGSSTVVARMSGVIRTLNTPADGQPRLIPDGLFVYQRR